MDHRDGKQAEEILKLQNSDGTWGTCFHALSLPNDRYALTTEQALRRLKILGFTREDKPVRKAVDCMTSCLTGERKIDDYWEKTHNWELFTKLMLSTWIRLFEPENTAAKAFAARWAGILEQAFLGGFYEQDAYLNAYTSEFNSRPKGSRELDFVDFYHINLLQGMLSKETEDRMLDYVLGKADGIFYVYNKPLGKVPETFASKETSWYLAAIEILTGFPLAKDKLTGIVNWLNRNTDENGQWDLGTKAKDQVYFPLSDSWRSADIRKLDCTERITGILQKLT